LANPVVPIEIRRPGPTP